MTTRSTALIALTIAFVGFFLSSCNKERIENIDIPKPFNPELGVDSIYWDNHTQATPKTQAPVPQIAGTKLDDNLRITTPTAVQIVVENTSSTTINDINLWARIQGVDEEIRIAYLDKIPANASQIYAPTFVHHAVYLPCKSLSVIQLFLPSIIQNSNITITYRLSDE